MIQKQNRVKKTNHNSSQVETSPKRKLKKPRVKRQPSVLKENRLNNLGKFLLLTSIVFGFGGLGFGFAMRHEQKFSLNFHLQCSIEEDHHNIHSQKNQKCLMGGASSSWGRLIQKRIIGQIVR